mmetsp:Transcript_22891/g.53575  ORF Transcript_22891/g.53575 Transcript_22891/m.53575 type:complete len:306 (+) Transcript_22891:41-958(+)
MPCLAHQSSLFDDRKFPEMDGQRWGGDSLPMIRFHTELHKEDEDNIFDWLRAAESTTQDGCGGSSLLQPAPDLRQRSPSVPGEVIHHIQAPPDEVRHAFDDFLEDEVTSQVLRATSSTDQASRSGRNPWEMEVIILRQYAPLYLRASLYDASSGWTAVVLQDTSRCDVVEFHHLLAHLASFFECRGLRVTSSNASHSAMARFRDEFLDDLEVEEVDEEALLLQLRPMVADACSGLSSLREEALQVLARLAQQVPASRRIMAQAIAEKEDFLKRLVDGLEEDGGVLSPELHARVCCVDFIKAGAGT